MTRIVVGIDGSANSQTALAWAVREARLRDADLEIVHAWTPPYVAGGLPMVPMPAPDLQMLREDARLVLDATLARLEEQPARARKVLADGGAGPALVKASESADMLVVGSRGHGQFSAMVLGSVSAYCVHHAHCPVVVVPVAKHGRHAREKTERATVS